MEGIEEIIETKVSTQWVVWITLQATTCCLRYKDVKNTLHTQLLITSQELISRVQFSPCDSNIIAFVNGNAIILGNLQTNHVVPLLRVTVSIGSISWAEAQMILFTSSVCLNTLALVDPLENLIKCNLEGDSWPPRYELEQLTYQVHLREIIWIGGDDQLIALVWQPSTLCNTWTASLWGLLSAKTKQWSKLKIPVTIGGMALAPNRQYIAISAWAEKPSWISNSRVGIVNLNRFWQYGTETEPLDLSIIIEGCDLFDKSIYDLLPCGPDATILELIGWSSDSRSILFAESVGFDTQVFEISLDHPDGKVVIQRTNSDSHKFSFSLLGTRVYYIARRFEHSDQIEWVDCGDYLTTHIFLEPHQRIRCKSELLHWKSDGYQIEAMVLYPRDYQPDKTYPLAVCLHGGPDSRFMKIFLRYTDRPFDLEQFYNNNLFVLLPNIRGSIGYGSSFRDALKHGHFCDSYKDVMLGIRTSFDKFPIDRARVVLLGLSYGGLIVSHCLAQKYLPLLDETNYSNNMEEFAFDLVVIIAGIANLSIFPQTTDISGYLGDYFCDQACEQVYKKLSPVEFLKSVQIPSKVILLSGEKDQRVPLSQTMELFQVLNTTGCKPELICYPNFGHFFERYEWDHVAKDACARIISHIYRTVK